MRSKRLDNIKGLLIFLIVFGHLLELFDKNKIAHGLYIAIYGFHVPAFVFCSGLVARYNPKKILSGIVYPYCIFQLLYLFARKETFKMLTPSWLMWYLFALAVWRLSLGLLENRKTALRLLPVSVACCLLAGFSKKIGIFFSLSRIICLYPLFLMGYILGGREYKYIWLKIYKLRYSFLIVFVFCILALGITSPAISKTAVYFRKSYAVWTDMLFRVFLLVTSASAIGVFFTFIKNRRCVLTNIGKNTMPVYLLHGFVVMWLKSMHLQNSVDNICTAVCFVLAAVLVFVLSRNLVIKLIMPFLSFNVKKFLH